MHELKEMVKFFKEDPKEAIGSVVVLLLLFGLFYVSIWLEAIISGRV